MTMSGISHLCHEHSPDCIRLTAKFPEVMSARMKRSSQLIGWVIAMLSGLISLANAQTFSSSYTSTAPKDCRTLGKPSDLDGSFLEVGPPRVLEQAHPELETQNALQGLVDLRLFHPAALHGCTARSSRRASQRNATRPSGSRRIRISSGSRRSCGPRSRRATRLALSPSPQLTF